LKKEKRADHLIFFGISDEGVNKQSDSGIPELGKGMLQSGNPQFDQRADNRFLDIYQTFGIVLVK